MSNKPPDKVTFVVLKSTRQVLAVATRQVVPAIAVPTGSENDKQLAANAAEELKVLVGDDLVVRDLFGPTSGSPLTVPDVLATIVIPAGDLEVVTIDSNPTLFQLKDARELVIGNDKKPVKGEDPASVSLHATANRVTVTLVDSPAEDTAVKVWIYRDDRSTPPVPTAGVIKKSDSSVGSPLNPASVDLPAWLITGDYHFVALVQGYKPAVYEQRI